MDINKRILECPHGIPLSLCDWIDDTFKWQKSIPGRGEENHERYLQMSGWQDIKDFLRAIAVAQSRGEFDRERTGLENTGVLDRMKNTGNPVLDQMISGSK